MLTVGVSTLSVASVANAATTTEPSSVWTHTYSAKCYPQEYQTNPQDCSLGIDGPTGESVDLQLGQELVDHSSMSGAREKLTVTAPQTCATGSVTLYALTRLDETITDNGSQTLLFDLRQGNSVVNGAPKLFTGPWHARVEPSLSGLVPASNCPGLPAATTFPLTLKLEAAPNSGRVGGLYQYPLRSGKLHVGFKATGGGTIDVSVRIRKLHSNGRWLSFGKVQKETTAPNRFDLTIRPSKAAKQLIRRGGYIIRKRHYFDLHTKVSIVDLYGSRNSTYDHASYSSVVRH